jgi:hypothetical protein
MAVENRDSRIEYVETTFTYKIPDDFRGDTFELGKTGTFTYKGPRYLTFEVDKETGRETGWCLIYPEELERPTPENVERIRIDCAETENGLLCEIANDQGDPRAVKFRLLREWEMHYESPEGYENLVRPVQYEPRDIYDEFNITYDFDTGEFNIPLHTWDTDMDTSVTWDDIRKHRDDLLKESDGAVAEDMPESIKNEWKAYRQLLRDLPTALAEFEPFIAAQMFPRAPDAVRSDPTVTPEMLAAFDE